ncbi:hypothetical protein [Pararhodobacter zhoushanensis]|uniref:Uncharacterized protein n=1 Tax=Pararhodobacter zhoushanensis TaxID=2479545 RepID=A0ABT3H416_9RHOB|nr:hypothetical protein [Pararhodobacter zhoushanensis]MCW1934565.1 hypothetical protein [Pararhodobacter zhoushanensis]
MTPDQRSCARHALGLPNGSRQSYRNHFCAPPCTTAHGQLSAPVAAGHARREQLRHDLDRFTLTASGARLALDPGETLCPEDFPKVLP